MSEHVDAEMMRDLISDCLNMALSKNNAPLTVQAAAGAGWVFELYTYSDGGLGIEATNHAIGQAAEFRVEVSET